MSKKTYLFDAKEGYLAMRKRLSDKEWREKDLRRGRHSEKKKPYKSKNYNRMEQLGGNDDDRDDKVDPPGCPDCDPSEPDPPPGCEEDPPDECFSRNKAIRQRCIDEWTKRCGKYLPVCSIHCQIPDCKKKEITCCVYLFFPIIGAERCNLNHLPRAITGLGNLISSYGNCGVYEYPSRLSRVSGEVPVAVEGCGAKCAGKAKIDNECCPPGECVITGTDNMTTSSTNQLSLVGDSCDFVRWCLSEESASSGSSIDQDGLITTGASSCGALTVRLVCGGSCETGTVVDTYRVRVSDAGQWVSAGGGTCKCGTDSTPACNKRCEVEDIRYDQVMCCVGSGESCGATPFRCTPQYLPCNCTTQTGTCSCDNPCGLDCDDECSVVGGTLAVCGLRSSTLTKWVCV